MAEKKERKSKLDRALTKEYKCYDCGNMIVNLKELVEKKIVVSVGYDKIVTRPFHHKCLVDYLDRIEDVDLSIKEDSDWDKVYKYFKKEYLKLEDWKNLSEHAVRRLRGLRIGQYYPSGNNVKILKRGYPYDTIHKAMIIAKGKALMMASEVNFKDQKHKTDFFMKFIVSEVEDVQLRIDKLKKTNESTQKAHENNKNVIVDDYAESYAKMVKEQEKEKVEEVKPIQSLTSIWGNILDDEDDE